jgi:hypothetical protein
MKTILLFLGIFVSISGFTQNSAEIFSSIGKGDVSAFSDKLMADVELCFDTQQDFFSKAEAVKKLKAYLTKIKPISAKHMHNGSSKDNSSTYSVGELNTETGNFRVFVYFEGNKIAGISFYPS